MFQFVPIVVLMQDAFVTIRRPKFVFAIMDLLEMVNPAKVYVAHFLNK